jgi:hypothetical protein
MPPVMNKNQGLAVNRLARAAGSRFQRVLAAWLIFSNANVGWDIRELGVESEEG